MNVSPRTAARAAYLAAGLNLAAALAMLILLRSGLPAPGSRSEDRALYLATHLSDWWGGWLLWHAAAIALLAFYASLAAQWWRAAPLRCALALLSAAAGLAADLSAEALYMGLAPTLAAPALTTLETAAALLTGYVGNGLYTVAGVLLTWAGGRSSHNTLPRPLVLLSLPVWVAGFALSAAALVRSSEGQFWSTAILMPAFVLWTALTGRWLSRQTHPAS